MSSLSRPRALLATLALVLSLVAGGSGAQEIAAVVNEDVVTDRDLRQRVRLALVATGQRPTEEAAARLRPQVLRALVDERLQLQEAGRLNIEVAEADVDGALDRIAAANNMPRQQLMSSLEGAGIDTATIRDQIRGQLAWRRVVQRQLLPRVIVSDVQVAQRLKEVNTGEPEFRLAEIFLPIYDPTEEQRVLQDALRLRESLQGGADFDALARQFSTAPSAERGGDLGWLAAASLPDELRQLVADLPDGGVSQPIRTQDGVYLFRRLGARAGGARLEVSMVRLDVTDPSEFDGDDLQQFAARTRAQTSDCAGLQAATAEIDGLAVREMEAIQPTELEGRLATVALTAEAGVLSEPLRTTDGTTSLVMVCERAGGANAEQRAQVEERLRGEALDRLATRYLRNLRRDAFIEIRLGQG